MLPALSPIDGNANFARIVGQVGTCGLCPSGLCMLLEPFAVGVSHVASYLSVFCLCSTTWQEYVMQVIAD